VPIVNLRRDMADPIEYNATRERSPILHSEVLQRYRLHQVVGVYRLDAADGLVPLRPGVLGETRDAYEIETQGRGESRRGYLVLDMPNAFLEPLRIAVDATWHQPVLEGDREYHFRVGLRDRYYDGVQWSCLGGMSTARDGELGDEVESLLRLLAIKNQRFLRFEELRFLLDALGIQRSRVFSGIAAALHDVEVESKPYARGTTGFKYVYHLTFRGLDRADVPGLELLCERLLDALKAWSIEEVVELVVNVPNLERVMHYA
jgi:type VI secretion system protein ImpG